VGEKAINRLDLASGSISELVSVPKHGYFLPREDQALKENSAKGDAYPGIAPRTWERTRLEKDGSLTCVRKGVIDFDLTGNGEVVFSNGKFLIRINREGKEQVIEKVDLVNRVRVR